MVFLFRKEEQQVDLGQDKTYYRARNGNAVPGIERATVLFQPRLFLWSSLFMWQLLLGVGKPGLLHVSIRGAMRGRSSYAVVGLKM